jgi:hypothetical protein
MPQKSRNSYNFTAQMRRLLHSAPGAKKSEKSAIYQENLPEHGQSA